MITHFLPRYCCTNVSSLAPWVLSQVRVDQGEVEVGPASPGLGVDLLHQTLQLLQGGVHPGVHLELIGRSVAWRFSQSETKYMPIIED